jgi:hypothetical protein
MAIDSNYQSLPAHFEDDHPSRTYFFTPNKTTGQPGRIIVLEDDFVGADGVGQWAEDLQNNATSARANSVAGTCGLHVLSTESTSQAQAAQITFGDILPINMSDGPIIEASLRVDTAGGSGLTADERIVFGLASAHANAEDALDTVTTLAWFRLEGANLNILVETDDGTTDTDDTDTGTDLADDTFTRLAIDCRDLSDILFYINGVRVTGADTDAGTISMADLAADTFVQPIICMQRDAGTEVNTVDIDWVICSVAANHRD